MSSLAVELIAQKAGASDFYFLYCEAGGRVMAAISVSEEACECDVMPSTYIDT